MNTCVGYVESLDIAFDNVLDSSITILEARSQKTSTADLVAQATQLAKNSGRYMQLKKVFEAALGSDTLDDILNKRASILDMGNKIPALRALLLGFITDSGGENQPPEPADIIRQKTINYKTQDNAFKHFEVKGTEKASELWLRIRSAIQGRTRNGKVVEMGNGRVDLMWAAIDIYRINAKWITENYPDTNKDDVKHLAMLYTIFGRPRYNISNVIARHTNSIGVIKKPIEVASGEGILAALSEAEPFWADEMGRAYLAMRSKLVGAYNRAKTTKKDKIKGRLNRLDSIAVPKIINILEEARKIIRTMEANVRSCKRSRVIDLIDLLKGFAFEEERKTQERFVDFLNKSTLHLVLSTLGYVACTMQGTSEINKAYSATNIAIDTRRILYDKLNDIIGYTKKLLRYLDVIVGLIEMSYLSMMLGVVQSKSINSQIASDVGDMLKELEDGNFDYEAELKNVASDIKLTTMQLRDIAKDRRVNGLGFLQVGGKILGSKDAYEFAVDMYDNSLADHTQRKYTQMKNRTA